MSAPSKIAAIRHAVSALNGAADDGADTRRYAEALQEVGAAIDELVEAGDAFWRATDFGRKACSPAIAKRFEAAVDRAKGGAA